MNKENKKLKGWCKLIGVVSIILLLVSSFSGCINTSEENLENAYDSLDDETKDKLSSALDDEVNRRVDERLKELEEQKETEEASSIILPDETEGDPYEIYKDVTCESLLPKNVDGFKPSGPKTFNYLFYDAIDGISQYYRTNNGQGINLMIYKYGNHEDFEAYSEYYMNGYSSFYLELLYSNEPFLFHILAYENSTTKTYATLKEIETIAYATGMYNSTEKLYVSETLEN